MVDNCGSCNHAEVCKFKEYRTQIQEELKSIKLNSDELHIVINCDKYQEISPTIGTGTVGIAAYQKCYEHPVVTI